jgi:hypothetical protein
MPEEESITLEDNIRRQCRIYIDSILAGTTGEILRLHAHAEFCRRLVLESDEEALAAILHNLDKVIGFTVESVGKPVPQDVRRLWAEALFDKVWNLYSYSVSKNVECVISPIYCENFEIYCEEQDIDYEFLVNDDDGMARHDAVI